MMAKPVPRPPAAASGVNPFRTAPGAPPPALVGRDVERDAAGLAADLIASGAPAQPVVFVGRRGMGKTTLLRRCVADIREAGRGVVIAIEAVQSERLAQTLRRGLEGAKKDLSPLGAAARRVVDKITGLLRSATYEMPNDMGGISLRPGSDPDEPLIAMLEDLNEAVRDRGQYLAFAIDELQEAPPNDLRTLVRFVHETAGTTKPVFFLGAGLPTTRATLHAARTYTERWRYFELKLLSAGETAEAIRRPLEERDVEIEPVVLGRLVTESAGYPYFIQEYASAAWAAWARKPGKEITLAHVEQSAAAMRRLLEDTLYDAAFRSLTPRECAYVLAMASLGPGPHGTGAIAQQLGATSSEVSSSRRRLVEKEVVYSPATGLTDFRIPLTERYIEGHREDLERRARSR